MYSKNMYCIQDRIQPNYELFGDGDLELMQCPSPLYAAEQPWSSSVCPVQPGQENNGPGRLSGTMLSRFESPAFAFYAAESCMGFPQNGCQASSMDQTKCSQYSKTCEVEFPLYRSCESFSISSAEKCYDTRSNGPAATMISPHKQDGLLVDDAAYVWRRISAPLNEQQNCKVSGNSYCYPLAQLSFSSKQEKQSPKFSSGSNCSASTSGYTSSTVPIMSNKTRIRWTQDLHEKFVVCVNRLGGAEKATPKAILKLMDSDGLTIFHIKSHLQKYRIAKYIPDSEKGRNDRRSSPDDFPQLDVKNGLQIKEALQLQLDVQRRLHEQLEIQRNLQLRIEEQGRQLRMMFNEQQRTTKALRNNKGEDSHEDGHFSAADCSENSYFPSKIS